MVTECFRPVSVLLSCLSSLSSNFGAVALTASTFLQDFSTKSELSGELMYLYTQLMAAISWIENLTSDALEMDPSEYEAYARPFYFEMHCFPFCVSFQFFHHSSKYPKTEPSVKLKYGRKN